jgi:sodium/bile acid cotransporter 7
MLAFLARRWFLLVLLVLGVLAWLRPEWLQWARRLDPRFIVGPALFLIALSLESKSLFESALRPWPVLWAVAVSYGLLPLLAWLAGPLLAPPDFRIGLMISAAVPCTLASAVLWTRLAGGNEAVALLVILITTGTSWLFTTAWLAFGTGTQVELDSAAMMRELFLVLVVPVGLGQAVRAAGPLGPWASKRKTWLGVLSQLLILAMILKAGLDVMARLEEETAAVRALDLLAVALVCLGTHLAALYGGMASARLVGMDRPSRLAIAFAGSQKTLPVALLLFDSHYAGYALAVVPMVCYHVGQLVVDTFIADHLARRPPRTRHIPSDAPV